MLKKLKGVLELMEWLQHMEVEIWATFTHFIKLQDWKQLKTLKIEK